MFNKGPEIPSHVLDSLRREEQAVERIKSQQKNIRNSNNAWMQSELMKDLSNQALGHRRLREQIASEFGLPAKYPPTRRMLNQER